MIRTSELAMLGFVLVVYNISHNIHWTMPQRLNSVNFQQSEVPRISSSIRLINPPSPSTPRITIGGGGGGGRGTAMRCSDPVPYG